MNDKSTLPDGLWSGHINFKVKGARRGLDHERFIEGVGNMLPELFDVDPDDVDAAWLVENEWFTSHTEEELAAEGSLADRYF